MRLILIGLTIIVLSGAVIFIAEPIVKEFHRSRAIQQEIDNLQKQADKMEMENKSLRDKIEYLKSDDYKKLIAKDRLNLRNPGEKVVVVQPEMEGASEDNNISGKLSGNSLKEEEIKSNYDDANKRNKKTAMNAGWSNFGKWWKYLFDSAKR